MSFLRILKLSGIVLMLGFFQPVFGAGVVVLEDFSGDTPGKFPQSWMPVKESGKELYLVVEDVVTKNRFLAVTDRGESVQIGKKITWDIRSYPVLKWSWRVTKLPFGASEANEETNDSAAGIYVVFDRAWFVIPRTIKYVWSSTLRVGTVIKKGYTRIVVLKSGVKEANRWAVESVNIYEDYKRFFNRKPVDPQGIAILTDANATKSFAVADYDDFRVFSPDSFRMVAGSRE